MRLLLAVTQHAQGHVRVGLGFGDAVAQVGDIVHLPAVHSHNQIALLQAAFFRRGAGADLGDQRAALPILR